MTAAKDFAARNYDRGMWVLERTRLSGLRRLVVEHAGGEILEIGAGTGANMPLYRAGATVTAIDLRPGHLAMAADKERRRHQRLDFAVTCADAQQLPFPAATFDTVLGTLVFCSIDHPEAALAEIWRVLRPGGRLILLEHVRGRTPMSRRLTDWLNPLWFAVQGTCRLNRDTATTVAAAGFRIDATSDHARGIIQVIQATAMND